MTERPKRRLLDRLSRHIGKVFIVAALLLILLGALVHIKQYGDPTQIVYKKDPRTGLCFGYASGYRAMTMVPCEVVKHLLVAE